MYSLWTTTSVNLLAEFERAKDIEEFVAHLIEDNGGQIVDELVLYTNVSEDSLGTYAAEGRAILGEITRLNSLEESLDTLARTAAALSLESERLVELLGADQLKRIAATPEWLQGFLAAAVHGVDFDIDSGELYADRSLAKPVVLPKQLEPTGD
jgi:hypothetical protein